MDEHRQKVVEERKAKAAARAEAVAKKQKELQDQQDAMERQMAEGYV